MHLETENDDGDGNKDDDDKCTIPFEVSFLTQREKN